MLHVATSGDAFERGRQHGAACATTAHPWFEQALSDLAQRTACGSVRGAIEALGARVEGWCRQAERVSPEAMQECRGIAAGMGLDAATYFTAVMAWRVSGATPSCTVLGFRDEGCRPLCAKTDDIAASELGMNILQVVAPDSGHRHVAFHFAGTIWTVAGMNEPGLAMAMTGIPGPTLAGDGVSSLVGLHAILPACATVDDAVALIEAQALHHGGYSVILADASGELALVEKNGAGTARLAERPGGYLLHTNHILDPRLRRGSPEQTEPVRGNGVRRFDRAEARVPTLARDAEGLRCLLSERGGPGAIWQEGQDGLHTDFGVILEPCERRLVCFTGPPDEADGQTVILSQVFCDEAEG